MPGPWPIAGERPGDRPRWTDLAARRTTSRRVISHRLVGTPGEPDGGDVARCRLLTASPCDTSPVTVQDHRELVAALLAVEGVAGASVEPGRGEPGTLRLQLSPGTDELHVAGAVNRLLRARFGLAVDSDRVRDPDEPGTVPPLRSGAQPEPYPAEPRSHGRHAHEGGTDRSPLREPAEGPESTSARSEPEGAADRTESSMPEPGGADVTGSGRAVPLRADLTLHVARPGRLAIVRVELVSAGLGVAVTVELSCRGRVVTGEAEGAATQTGVHRSVAVATLRAVEAAVEGKARFEVEHIELTRSGPDQTVLVVLTMVTGRSTQRLSGASVVREDVRQAVVRAVLDSVNRRMEPMLVPT